MSIYCHYIALISILNREERTPFIFSGILSLCIRRDFYFTLDRQDRNPYCISITRIDWTLLLLCRSFPRRGRFSASDLGK